MNGFLVPANAKKGTLILNLFRPFDIIMFGIGLVVSLLSLVIVDADKTLNVLLSCLPAAITGLLVVPIPNYHNVLCAIQSIFKFFLERRNYYWKGWCFYEEFDSDNESKK